MPCGRMNNGYKKIACSVRVMERKAYPSFNIMAASRLWRIMAVVTKEKNYVTTTLFNAKETAGMMHEHEANLSLTDNRVRCIIISSYEGGERYGCCICPEGSDLPFMGGCIRQHSLL